MQNCIEMHFMHHSKPLRYAQVLAADPGTPLKGRSSQSLEQVQVYRVQIQNYASDLITKKLVARLNDNHNTIL